jgi:hypothetical protein
VVARFVHTEEVTGSNPVSPTTKWPSEGLLSKSGKWQRAKCEPNSTPSQSAVTLLSGFQDLEDEGW